MPDRPIALECGPRVLEVAAQVNVGPTELRLEVSAPRGAIVFDIEKKITVGEANSAILEGFVVEADR